MCLSYQSSEETYYWVPELISVWERLTQSGVFLSASPHLSELKPCEFF